MSIPINEQTTNNTNPENNIEKELNCGMTEEAKKVTLFQSGVISMPPSKSIAHRALICAGLSSDKSSIRNLPDSDDINATTRCLRALVEKNNATDATHILDCGESGTTLRFLIPIAAALGQSVIFTGHGRLMKRPLDTYFDILTVHGVKMTRNKSASGQLFVSGQLTSGLFELPGHISSQFVSGLLLALPLLSGDSVVQITTPLESASYVDLTIDTMQQFGVIIENSGYQKFIIRGGQQYQSRSLSIEGDYSQAAFFLVAGALGCSCSCQGLSNTSKQGDRMILEILKKSSATLHFDGQDCYSATAGKLLAQTVDVSDIPDLVPPLAVFLCFCEGESRIINAGRLRLKESDRLNAVTTELNKLGAHIIIEDDSLLIHGVKSFQGGCVDSHNDHRIAMMAAVAAIKSTNPVYIEGSNCVTKSYPAFWHDFEKEVRA